VRKLICKSVLKVNPYVPGKPIEETKRELGLKEVIKLASNENPLGASPKALNAIKKALSGINRYPDAQGYYLKKSLAKSLGLEPENFVLGNGSDELIDVLIKTLVEPQENIVTSEGTFLEYEIVAQVNGRKVKKAPLYNFKYDLEKMLKLVDPKTKLVFIANPNNPTGTYVSKNKVLDFINALPPKVFVVFDEAYNTFIDVDDYPDTLSFLKNNKRVIILRTFSKAYGLAGLRLGYAIADPELTGYLERIRQPFNVNLLAQVAGCAALEDKAFLEKTRRLTLSGKDFFYREFSKLGINYICSEANFILVDTGRDGRQIFNAMLKSGVIVREMSQYGLKNFVRITIGTPSENKKLLKVLSKAIKGKKK
jgi:histidinol-phosphate aminotransferase